MITPIVAKWLLIAVFSGARDGSVVYIPFQTEKACVAAKGLIYKTISKDNMFDLDTITCINDVNAITK
jgi:hypothetical protein